MALPRRPEGTEPAAPTGPLGSPAVFAAGCNLSPARKGRGTALHTGQGLGPGGEAPVTVTWREGLQVSEVLTELNEGHPARSPSTGGFSGWTSGGFCCVKTYKRRACRACRCSCPRVQVPQGATRWQHRAAQEGGGDPVSRPPPTGAAFGPSRCGLRKAGEPAHPSPARSQRQRRVLQGPHRCTRSTRWAISWSEMPGQDSSARLKAFSSSSSAPTPPPLCRCFSLSCGHSTGPAAGFHPFLRRARAVGAPEGPG